VATGSIRDDEFMADPSRVVNHTAPADYLDPIVFFAKSYPTCGITELLKAVCLRLFGKVKLGSNSVKPWGSNSQTLQTRDSTLNIFSA
jgi:predicted AAA+ superfamily ATPase